MEEIRLWLGLEPKKKRPVSDLTRMKMTLTHQLPRAIDNIKTFTNYKPLDEKEMAIIKEVRQNILELSKVDCTSCNYCMPCPHGVNIPGVFKYINDASIFDQHDFYKERYFKFMSEDTRATACIACGECLPKCPQKIDIVSDMKRVVELFG